MQKRYTSFSNFYHTINLVDNKTGKSIRLEDEDYMEYKNKIEDEDEQTVIATYFK
jgi:hypothetical protein